MYRIGKVQNRKTHRHSRAKYRMGKHTGTVEQIQNGKTQRYSRTK